MKDESAETKLPRSGASKHPPESTAVFLDRAVPSALKAQSMEATPPSLTGAELKVMLASLVTAAAYLA